MKDEETISSLNSKIAILGMLTLPATAVLVLGLCSLLVENTFGLPIPLSYTLTGVGLIIETWGAVKVMSIIKKKNKLESAN